MERVYSESRVVVTTGAQLRSTGTGQSPVTTRADTTFLLRALFLGQPHLCGVEFLLYPHGVCRVDIGGNLPVPLGERSLPVGGGHLQASSFLVQIAQVVVDGGIGINS